MHKYLSDKKQGFDWVRDIELNMKADSAMNERTT